MNFTNARTRSKVVAALAVLPLISLVFYPVVSSAAPPVITQGVTSSYAVLAATGITVTTSASISGTAGSDIGTSTATITGAVPSPVGVIQSLAAAGIAQTALVTAVSNVNGASGVVPILPQLSAQTLFAGNYSSGAIQNSGSVTFDGQGNPNAIFTIKASSSLLLDPGSTMNLINGAQACNIFWNVATSATLDTSSSFYGHLYAAVSISALNGATIHGNLLAQTGAVTLINNTITNDNCLPAVVAIPMPIPVQQSQITSVTPANCVVSGTTAVKLNGNFLTPVSNVTVNGVAVAAGSWIQTPTTVTLNTVVSGTNPISIQVFNGQVPLLATQSFVCTPVAVVVPVPPVLPPVVPPVITPVAPGTIHVIKIVVNAFGGSATPGDFSLSLKNHGVDVLGSPNIGLAAPGRAYLLAPGTYVLGEAKSSVFPDYISSFDIVGQSSNFINLKSGDDLTIIETNTQLPPVVVPVVVVPTPTKTVTGGKLPKTGSPWYNMLLLSAGLVLLGSGMIYFQKTTSKK